MKFRNPETGEVLSILDAVNKYCKQRWCDNCLLREPIGDLDRMCSDWAETHPHEAARLMSYEVIREPGIDFPEPEYDPADVAFKGAEIDEEHTETHEKTHTDAIENACVQSKGVEIDTVKPIENDRVNSTKIEAIEAIKEANMDKSDQQAKADAGKLEIDMVPTQIIRDIAEVRMYGNRKYHDPQNWKTVELRRYINAMLRHTLAFVDDPYGVDSESGIPHYKHAECNWSFISEILGGRVSKEAHNAQT